MKVNRAKSMPAGHNTKVLYVDDAVLELRGPILGDVWRSWRSLPWSVPPSLSSAAGRSAVVGLQTRRRGRGNGRQIRPKARSRSRRLSSKLAATQAELAAIHRRR